MLQDSEFNIGGAMSNGETAFIIRIDDDQQVSCHLSFFQASQARSSHLRVKPFAPSSPQLTVACH